ncbi:hypothetical protein FG386_002652 [Cryptosporidium ryanae]|uniref:uncharacterized protein n=1 Tax=Cryptosporidium ryanae TaxID=515981 RepID=UPI003519FA96|nr:hypothetical protein FG386_002652 [Cryptosporidium ryanae]
MTSFEPYSDDEYLVIINADEYFTEKEQNKLIDLNSNKYYVYRRGEFLGYNSENRSLNLKEIILEFNKIRELVEKANFIVLNKNLSVPRIIEKSTFLRRDLKFDRQILVNEFLRIKELIQNYICNRLDSVINGSKVGKLIREKIKAINLAFEKVKMKEVNEIYNNENIEKLKNDPFSYNLSNKEVINLIVDDVEIESSEKSSEKSPQSVARYCSKINQLSKMEKEFDNNSDDCLDDTGSNISRKSEPIVYSRIKQNWFRKSGTVINAGSVIDYKTSKEKYQEFLKSCRNISVRSEIKENMSTNKV